MEGFKRIFKKFDHLLTNEGNPFTTVDRMCTELRTMGVEAYPTIEKEKKKDKYRTIDVIGSPIQWINLKISLSGDDPSHMEYVIPDSRKLLPVYLKSIYIRKKPIWGEIIDIRWQGFDEGTGLIHILNNDETIKNSILDTCEVEIEGYPKKGYWIIIQERWGFYSPIVKNHQWKCYENIAEYLLRTPLSA